jgi:hypothetical protein
MEKYHRFLRHRKGCPIQGLRKQKFTPPFDGLCENSTLRNAPLALGQAVNKEARAVSWQRRNGLGIVPVQYNRAIAPPSSEPQPPRKGYTGIPNEIINTHVWACLSTRASKGLVTLWQHVNRQSGNTEVFANQSRLAHLLGYESERTVRRILKELIDSGLGAWGPGVRNLDERGRPRQSFFLLLPKSGQPCPDSGPKSGHVCPQKPDKVVQSSHALINKGTIPSQQQAEVVAGKEKEVKTTSPSLKLLLERGIKQSKASELAAKHSEKAIRSAIKALRLAAEHCQIGNPSGWIIAALEDGYDTTQAAINEMSSSEALRAWEAIPCDCTPIADGRNELLRKLGLRYRQNPAVAQKIKDVLAGSTPNEKMLAELLRMRCR